MDWLDPARAPEAVKDPLVWIWYAMVEAHEAGIKRPERVRWSPHDEGGLGRQRWRDLCWQTRYGNEVDGYTIRGK